MKSLEQFLALLALIPDPRRAEGKLYQLPHVLLFSILAIVSGANSYRGVGTFIKVHRRKLNKAFKIGWKRPPRPYVDPFHSAGAEGGGCREGFSRTCRKPEQRQNRFARAPWRSTARRSKAVSTPSTTHARNRCSARSPPARRWFWRISRSAKNPTGSQRCENCWKNSTLRITLSRVMRCIAKKTFEAAAAARAHLIVQLKDNQPTSHRKVEAVCNGATPLSGVQTADGKKRDRHETRAVAVFGAAPAVMGTQWEPCVAAIIQVERIVPTFQAATGLWRRSCENSFVKVWI